MRTTERAPERTAAPFGNPPVGQRLGIPFMAAFYHWSVGSWRRRFVIARRIPKTRMYAYLRIPCIFARARLTSRRLEAEPPKGSIASPFRHADSGLRWCCCQGGNSGRASTRTGEAYVADPLDPPAEPDTVPDLAEL